jgi:hypothetical protein
MMTMDDFKPYLFPPGMVSTSDERNNNMLGSTGLAWALMAKLGSKVNYGSVLNVLLPCRVVSGIYRRNPSGQSPIETADDYYGLVAGLALNDYGFEVRLILKAWRDCWGMMNSEDPTGFAWKAWFIRFPALYAHICYGSNEKPGIFARTWWALIGVRLTCFRSAKAQDAYIQTWCMVQVYEHQEFRTPMADAACERFKARLDKLGGLSQILEDYIGPNHPDNPLIRFAKETEQ